VIAFPRSSRQRVLVAIVFSILLHAAILWLPHIRLAKIDVHFAPLSVRLEATHKQEAQPATTPHLLTQTDESNKIYSEAIGSSTDIRHEVEQAAQSQQFPKQVKLTFAVQKTADVEGGDEIRHQLDIHQDRYTLKAIRQEYLTNKQLVIYVSQGRISQNGLQPDSFSSEIGSHRARDKLITHFDWVENKLHSSSGLETDLPADTQDSLSFMYQLSQLSMHREIIPMSITDGLAQMNWEIEIGREEKISTPAGELRALHLRKMHIQDEAYFEIWLGIDYRLLPVKYSQINSSGETVEEYVLSDIQIEDD
jgi:hypothetical protein